MGYILNWYSETVQDKTGYTLYTFIELLELIKPYHKEAFPLNSTKFGKDLKNCKFIAKRRTHKGFQYSVNWDYEYTPLEINEILEHAHDHD